jgi:hypothetical protein
MDLGRLNHTSVAVQPKPLPFRRGGTSPPDWSERLHGVGVGSFRVAQGLQNPTPLRLAHKCVSLAAPPLKGRGKCLDLGRLHQIAVTPAQAGVHHRWMKFERQEMDSRLRGNDEFRDLEVAR